MEDKMIAKFHKKCRVHNWLDKVNELFCDPDLEIIMDLILKIVSRK